MAMPTEEKRVVKKVVVQPDWTKKVIKKIIKKVPKKDWVIGAVPTTEKTPISTWENLESTNPVNFDDVSSLFWTQDNQKNLSEENNNQSENQLNDGHIQGLQDAQAITQSENSEAWSTIDLWSFDFNQGNQAVSQEAPTQQETADLQENSWVVTSDMDSLLWGTPLPENNSVESETLENQATTENQATLDLNQMIPEPEQIVDQDQQKVQTAGAENTEDNFDPFMAMKTTLESTDMSQSTLDLDSITNEPATQPVQTVTPVVQAGNQSTIQPVVQQTETAEKSDVPTLDLNDIPSQTPVANAENITTNVTKPENWNPVTANIMQNIWWIVNLWGITLDAKKKKMITIAASCFWVLVLFAIVFIRYPDMFAWSSLEEHGSYEPTQNSNWQTWNTITQQNENSQSWNSWTTENPSDSGTGTQIMVNSDEEIVIKQKDPIVIDWENFFDDEDIPTVELDEISINTSTSGAVNPLAEIEWLIGPVSGSDTIVQEASEYVKKGKELKDMWAGQNNRNKMRYWIFIEWKAQETLDALEKGENIDISTWISLKAQFDDYLQKATDA